MSSPTYEPTVVTMNGTIAHSCECGNKTATVDRCKSWEPETNYKYMLKCTNCLRREWM